MSLVLLVVHLLIAVALVGLVLTQRSEGGALGMGGGASSLISGRGAADILARLTMGAGAIFFLTSIVLSVTSRSERSGGSVVDRAPAAALETPAEPATTPEPAPSPEEGAIVPSPAEAVQRAGPLTDRPAEEAESLIAREPRPQERPAPVRTAPAPTTQRSTPANANTAPAIRQPPPAAPVQPIETAEPAPESVEPPPAPQPRPRAGPEE